MTEKESSECHKTLDFRKTHASSSCKAIWRKGLAVLPLHHHVSPPLSLSHLFQFVMLYFSLKRARLLVSGPI